MGFAKCLLSDFQGLSTVSNRKSRERSFSKLIRSEWGQRGGGGGGGGGEGVLPIIVGYMGRFHPKGVPFSGWSKGKGRETAIWVF